MYIVQILLGESTWDRPEPDNTPADNVRASHILIKHQGSRRLASWKVLSCIYLYNIIAVSYLKA